MAFYEVVIEGRQGGNDMLNVLHYESSGVEPPDFDLAATVIRGHLEDHMQSLCGARVTWLGITVRQDIPGGVGTFYPFGAGVLTGNATNQEQADILTMLVRKVTGSLIKPTLGWAQQGGITTDALEANSVWDTTVQDEVKAYWEDIRVINITGPSTLTMVIKARNPEAPNTQPYTPVNSISIGGSPRALSSRFITKGS